MSTGIKLSSSVIRMFETVPDLDVGLLGKSTSYTKLGGPLLKMIPDDLTKLENIFMPFK